MTDETADIGEEAVQWVVRLNSDQRTRADEDAFRAWLDQGPAHANAYADCAALWEGVRELAAGDEAPEQLSSLRAPARAGGGFNRRAALVWGAASAVAAGVAGWMVLDREHIQRTAPGEQRRVRLADGSGVLLNTDTRLRVKFVEGERRLFLDRGQAYFQVAKDKARPFRVFAGLDEIRALGTAFEVRLVGDRVKVTLEEGRVAIYRGGVPRPESAGALAWAREATGLSPVLAEMSGSARPAAVLSPGQQAQFAVAEPIVVRPADLRKVQAWRYGRMILDDAALGETVADLNRYGGVQIALADPKLAGIRVSGVFHTGRPDDFVESVVAAFPVEIDHQDANLIVLKPR